MGSDFESSVRAATREFIGARPGGVRSASLSDMGWAELRAEEPRIATTILFEEIGRAAVASDALDSVVLAALADGGAIVPETPPVAVLYYLPGRHSTGRYGSTATRVDGILLSSTPTERVLAPLSRENGTTVVALLDPDALNCATTTAVAGVAPEVGITRLSVDECPVLEVWDGEAAASFGSAARLAVAHQSTGLARAMLAVAVDHVRERHQFGRPIGSYQAVQHRLVDVEVAIAAAEALAAQCWDLPSSDPMLILATKARAAAALDTAVKHTLQVCGGMGFTDEFPLARLVRWALFLSSFLGGANALSAAIGRNLVAAGQVRRTPGFVA